MEIVPSPPKRILTFLPLPYHGIPGDWHRDVGLITMELRRAGHDASMVMFESDVPIVDGEPVIVASRDEIESPDFWLSLKPWGIISNTWGAGRFKTVWNSMMQATPRLADRLDTDGLRSHRIDPLGYWHDRCSRIHDFQRRRWRRWFSRLIPLAHMGVHQIVPGLLDRPQAETFTSLPAVSAESPAARERIVRHLRIFSQPADNVHHVPHPVEQADMLPLASLATREKHVVSIGRWESHQKNLPMMIKILAAFLANHSDWNVSLLGSVPKDIESLVASVAGDQSQRIEITGPIPHDELSRRLSSAQIFLMTSRHESFNIAAAEALCAGCSVVAPPQIASASWFCGSDSGTVSTRYSASSLLDALEVERTAWAEARRDPVGIAATWRARVSARAVAESFVRILSEIEG